MVAMCVSVHIKRWSKFSRETEEGERSKGGREGFKGLVHFEGAAKSEICRAGWQAEN